ncbi:unnamed protein product [Protopolystoma xenopodis]|uniref:Uncharacterized protein n=1 Tax=Protopolystoma xenopodis TaxID=117903 RepID=A0A3S5CH15_9PLAT|nr:unnamed protein product [Protopolystoma xenopodis]
MSPLAAIALKSTIKPTIACCLAIKTRLVQLVLSSLVLMFPSTILALMLWPRLLRASRANTVLNYLNSAEDVFCLLDPNLTHLTPPCTSPWHQALPQLRRIIVPAVRQAHQHHLARQHKMLSRVATAY